jgi:hypothetical protein
MKRHTTFKMYAHKHLMIDGWTDGLRNKHHTSMHTQTQEDGLYRQIYKHKHITNGPTDGKNDYHANINTQSQTDRWMDGDTTIHT